MLEGMEQQDPSEKISTILLSQLRARIPGTWQTIFIWQEAHDLLHPEYQNVLHDSVTMLFQEDTIIVYIGFLNICLPELWNAQLNCIGSKTPRCTLYGQLVWRMQQCARLHQDSKPLRHADTLP